MSTSSESQLFSLIQQSERAWASGQKAEATRLLESARAIAPDHALVLNATGVQEMDRGNVESARTFIQNAIVKDPTQAGFYLNLASILRRQQLRDEEMK